MASADLPPVVHFFGFAHVARTFHQLLERLGRTVDVVVYTLSPCEGFWEDVDRNDPAPLHLWSRPGRDHVRALNAIAGFEHEDRFVDPLASAGRTAGLCALMFFLLRRRPPDAPPPPRWAVLGASALAVVAGVASVVLALPSF